MYPNASYVDGLQAVVALSVYNYNTGKVYMTYSGNPAVGAAQTELRNSDNQLIGSVTYIDGRKGTVNCQYDLAADEVSALVEVKPDHIISFRGRFYVVGAVTPSVTKNNVIKFSFAVTELQNPFIPLLLSLLGQQLARSQAHASGFTQSAAASGTRIGSTLVYSLETFATPGSAAPTNFTISPSTGLITYDGSGIAGAYDMRVICADTVTLPDGTTNTIYGFGRFTVVLT